MPFIITFGCQRKRVLTMIFIAESGSTKCDAVILKDDGSELTRISLKGLNPQHLSPSQIQEELSSNSSIQQFGRQIKEVFFYGSGCSSPQANQVVCRALQAVFAAAKITVHEDILAVAYAASYQKASICCILGTGSNCFYFDGERAQMGTAGLGYILGDEGSGGDIGKKLLQGFLHHKLPVHLEEKFNEAYSLNRAEIIKRVYRTSGANTFIASFSSFVGQNITDPFCRQLVYQSFTHFVQLHIAYFKPTTQLPIHFVGSVAFHFREILKQVLLENGLTLGEIIAKPLDRLVQFHTQKHIQEKG